MIKVIQFIHGLNMGGAETLVKEYALGLDKRKFDVTVLCLEHRDSPYEEILKEAGIKTIYICDEISLSNKKNAFSKLQNKLAYYIYLRRYMRSVKPDVIHVHLLLNKLIRFAGLHKSVKVVYTQHFQVDRWVRNYSSEIRAVRWLLNHYDTQLIALNRDMKKEIDKIFHIESTIVINNGINLSRYYNKMARATKRKELVITENAFIVGHVGRFNTLKNHKFLVDVFAEIHKKRPDSKLILVGSGDTETSICNKLDSMGLLYNTIILHNRTDVPDLLHAMDIMIFPSLSEGLGISVIEAQVAGVKCLASDVVPSATRISNLISFKNLSDGAQSWADYALQWCSENTCPAYYDLEKWDMEQGIKQLEHVYLNDSNRLLRRKASYNE